ncbi:PH domain-containing protein [Streptococcus hillyeri]|uniref:PH domain-containing protein n=1 Tax=Streptococcus hillyeri TaxID=2282420 RepID=A0A3L9DQC7_9STRE|nr:PH domain-containing protein [Streptococcus hillyeri]RLY02398.1 PH domain-containing protein [Streptococcus hillyeri]
MGIFSGMIGNASQKDNDKVERQLEDILIPGEQVTLAYSLVRDLIVFTEKRLILVDKQGVTGKKTSYKSIPYRSISRFTVETSGHFDLDAELKIWISSAVEPAEVLQFKSDRNVVEIQQALAEAVLR